MADSAICPDMSQHSSSDAPPDEYNIVNRDQSLDSISSFSFSGLPTPAEPPQLPPINQESEESEDVVINTLDIPEANGSLDAPITPEIASVQQEIRMLRQISNRFPEESRNSEENQWRTNMTLGFTGGILFAIAAFIIYKKWR